MKRFLLKTLLFLLPLPLIWSVLVFIYGKLVPEEYQKNIFYTSAGGYSYSRIREADTLSKVDVLVLGSSHAYRGFDPRIFAANGIRLFNLGTSAQRAVQTRYLVEKYIDRLNPRLVIFEVSAMNLTGDGLESALDLCYSMPEPDGDLFEMVLEVNHVKAYNTFMYALMEKIDGEEPKKELQLRGDRYISGGYVESHATARDKSELYTPAFQERVDLKKSAQLDDFEETLRILREKRLPVILVQTPVSIAHYRSVLNQEEIDNYLSSFEGISYYNFNKLITLGDTCFYDPHHLNQRGVELFNKALISQLGSSGKGDFAALLRPPVPGKDKARLAQAQKSAL